MDKETIRERREALTQDFLESIRSLIFDASEEYNRLLEQGEEVMGRYDDLCSELESIDKELPDLRHRVEELPTLAYAENMRGDSLEEESLRGEFTATEQKIEELENRREELVSELEEMTPHGPAARSEEQKRGDVEQEAFRASREVRVALWQQMAYLLENASPSGLVRIEDLVRREAKNLPGSVPEHMTFSSAWRKVS